MPMLQIPSNLYQVRLTCTASPPSLSSRSMACMADAPFSVVSAARPCNSYSIYCYHYHYFLSNLHVFYFLFSCFKGLLPTGSEQHEVLLLGVFRNEYFRLVTILTSLKYSFLNTPNSNTSCCSLPVGVFLSISTI